MRPKKSAQKVLNPALGYVRFFGLIIPVVIACVWGGIHPAGNAIWGGIQGGAVAVLFGIPGWMLDEAMLRRRATRMGIAPYILSTDPAFSALGKTAAEVNMDQFMAMRKKMLKVLLVSLAVLLLLLLAVTIFA